MAQRHTIRLGDGTVRVISAFGTFLSRCLDPLTPLVRSGPSTIPHESATERQRPSARPPGRGAGPAPAPRAPHAPPAPVSELPVLRFAEARETREAEDMYEGEEARRRFPALWRWAVRAVLVGGLVTGGVLAALYWK